MMGTALAWALALAWGQETPEDGPEEVERAPVATLDVHGDLKSFFTATLPYASEALPDDPLGQGVWDARLKMTGELGRAVRFELHGTSTALAPAPASDGLGGTSTGVGLRAPEALELSYRWKGSDGLQVQGRVDRALLRAETGSVTTTLGRQAISFGNSLVFTPLDLVNPFTPAVIDQEYKPGVDAVRVDVYRGLSYVCLLYTSDAADE